MNSPSPSPSSSIWEQKSCRTRKQDFVAPAPYHMSIEVVSVRVRERTSMRRECLLQSSLGLWRRDRGCQISRQNIQKSEQMISTEGQIMSSCQGRMILLFNSTILQGGCHSVEGFANFERRNGNNQSLLSHKKTEKQRDRQISKAVHDKSKKFDENRTIVHQDLNISWHHTLSRTRICFFVSPIRIWLSSLSVSLIIQIQKLRLSWDYFWSQQKTSTSQATAIKISLHPHPTICLLRWWVSEWESTSIERERLLDLCLGQAPIEMH